MASKGKDQPKKAPKKKNGYQMPKPLKTGDILNDTQKGQWKIGVSIGIGGFGEIYSACKVGATVKKVEDYPYVVKIEPKENGPLFVEMHFYNRNARHDDIETFRKTHKLKTLGMPEFIGMGSHEIETVKHRFIVLPRFGRDIWKIFEQNHIFPLHTVYRIGWQVLNVLEYVHNRDYVHMDIKGTNILLGFGKGGEENVFLLDFGLACHANTKDYKPDPKKMHNGTIEYTSRDAHLGVPTMRGDLEVLAYNLIEWSGAKLPWVEKKLLAKPADVQKSKEDFMKNFDKSLKAAYGSASVPGHITAFFKYLVGLNHDSKPDYTKIRGIFEAGLKELSQKNSGPLDFAVPKPSEPAAKKKPAVVAKPNFGEPSKEPAASKRNKVQKKYVESDSEDEVEVPKKKAAAAKKPSKKAEPEIVKPEEPKAQKRVREAAKKVLTQIDSESSENEAVPPARSPKKKPRGNVSPRSTSKENDEEPNVSPPQKKPKNKSSKNDEEPEKASKTITIKSKSSSKGGKKTIQLNFNLDVSLDSDLVVVVNRKDKDKKKKEAAAEEKNRCRRKTRRWRGK